jgi:hypothetical protein
MPASRPVTWNASLPARHGRGGNPQLPMIDVYATAGTFTDNHQLARDLSATLMAIEGAPGIRTCVLLTEAVPGGWDSAVTRIPTTSSSPRPATRSPSCKHPDRQPDHGRRTHSGNSWQPLATTARPARP